MIIYSFWMYIAIVVFLIAFVWMGIYIRMSGKKHKKEREERNEEVFELNRDNYGWIKNTTYGDVEFIEVIPMVKVTVGEDCFDVREEDFEESEVSFKVFEGTYLYKDKIEDFKKYALGLGILKGESLYQRELVIVRSVEKEGKLEYIMITFPLVTFPKRNNPVVMECYSGKWKEVYLPFLLDDLHKRWKRAKGL